ncbi:MAG: hypothetical protein JNG89_12805 [Planctomycetaceae bacterium]|nr:hypothetical protein [Planctomycetaceae bacterium]
MAVKALGPFNIDRVFMAVEKQRERLLRATRALAEAGVPYAVTGDNAVASWVSRVDEAAVRFTQDIDILLRREDLAAATAALEPAGFPYRHSAGIHMFLDGSEGKFRDAVHVIFTEEKVRNEYTQPAPGIQDSEPATDYRVLTLDALVRMKLTSFRDKDRTHVRDMLDVGLIDAGWTSRLPPDLAARLQTLVDSPDG